MIKLRILRWDCPGLSECTQCNYWKGPDKRDKELSELERQVIIKAGQRNGCQDATRLTLKTEERDHKSGNTSGLLEAGKDKQMNS